MIAVLCLVLGESEVEVLAQILYSRCRRRSKLGLPSSVPRAKATHSPANSGRLWQREVRRKLDLTRPATTRLSDNLEQSANTVNMGRLHSKGKGISSSALPYSRSAPAWLKTTPDQVVDQICKLAKKGATPSQIGVVLRDSHGVAQVKFVTGMVCDARGREEKKW